MPNRAIQGGSPLGLIGVKSSSNLGGLSTFNAGTSRNVNVNQYNASKAGTLFSGVRVVRAFPNIKPIVDNDEKLDDKETSNPTFGQTSYDTKGVNDVQFPNAFDGKNSKGYDNFTRSELHNDTVYDVSVLNIIEKMSGSKGMLKPADFAFLKNIGVFPNNRLMIARRFASPVDDNVVVPRRSKGGKPVELGPLATLISWVKDTEDFLEITFGEEWTAAEADFKGILQSLGEDVGLSNLGGISGAAGNALPLPGFTEIFQRQFLASLGLLESGSANQIPAGNPNLIKEAKRRKTIGYSEAGSGLSCTCNIKMTCEYEMKYISGIDPTIVWMDLLGGILRFGTSNSSNYGLSGSLAAKLSRWANNPSTLIKDVLASIKKAITEVITIVKQAITAAFNAAKALADKLPSSPPDPNAPAGPEPSEAEKATKEAEKQRDEQNTLAEKISSVFGNISMGLVMKYRVRVLGIVHALSGLPSTPWHISIGNPLRPVFCSGDMLTTAVTLKFGPQLAFNDLPSSIIVDFTLTNARPWGLQEIMAKFNSGYLRTVDIQKTYFETSAKIPTDAQTGKPTSGDILEEPPGSMPFTQFPVLDNAGTQSNPGAGPSGSTSPAQGTSASTTGTNTTTPAAAAGGGSQSGGTPGLSASESKTLKTTSDKGTDKDAGRNG